MEESVACVDEGVPYIYLAMLKSQFQVIVDRLVGDLAEESQVGDTNLLLLGGFKGGLLDLALARLTAIADICDSFGATKTTLLFPALGTS